MLSQWGPADICSMHEVLEKITHWRKNDVTHEIKVSKSDISIHKSREETPRALLQQCRSMLDGSQQSN